MKPAILVGVVCVPLVSGCGPHLVKLPNAIPAAVQMQLGRVPRVWIAGFVSGSNVDHIDLNLETVRLLRQELRAVGSVSVLDAEPLTIPTEEVFADESYWRGLGEEHGSPLIVTGSVKLILAPPLVVQRGFRTVYLAKAGRVLEATIVTIDGRTGRVIKTTPLPGRVRYGVGRFPSGLSLFFELMLQSKADWFKAIAGEADTTAAAPLFQRRQHSRAALIAISDGARALQRPGPQPRLPAIPSDHWGRHVTMSATVSISRA
jgi:hypothetical protein